jgi:hypothetical protein
MKKDVPGIEYIFDMIINSIQFKRLLQLSKHILIAN